MDPRDTLVVTGTGRATTAPDMLVVDLQLEGHGPTVTEALAALTRAVEAATQALPDHRARTQGLGVHPRHDHQGRQVGHTAYQSLQVRTGDPTQVGDLVARLAQVVGSGLGVNGLRPEVSDPAPAARQAREAAFAQAREAAEQWAGLTGRRLGEVLWVREGGGPPPRPFGGGMEDARMALAAGPPVDPAEHEVVVAVEICWALLPA